MIKAVVTRGMILPRDPLPDDWQEGTEVAVEKLSRRDLSDTENHSTDAWMNEVEAIAVQGDHEDDRRLEAAIQETRSREKELARNKLGLEQ